MMKPTSFAADIRPLFTQKDIDGMKKGFNLASYDEVKAHAAAIHDRIRGIGGALMPPYRHAGKALGRKLALIYLRNGSRTGASLKPPTRLP